MFHLYSKIYIIFKNEFIEDAEQKKLFKSSVKLLINKIFIQEEVNFSTITLIFCNDKTIRQYNKKYLGHDYETDIITFHDKDDMNKVEGELLISVDTVKHNFKRFKTDFQKELYRVIIHGILHLCGYKDKTSSHKLAIRKKENYYLKFI